MSVGVTVRCVWRRRAARWSPESLPGGGAGLSGAGRMGPGVGGRFSSSPLLPSPPFFPRVGQRTGRPEWFLLE
ncbi:hypothetical protein E2C01_033717 [Portunus trituberculatus]|uniref:Uncharacterized protein n=1 Tax=Portunus trituberculatus TaxID=210409 RepID=A0A5B7F0V0_PORTR|nr:hypothetical protein [Portunus trituberculatus]